MLKRLEDLILFSKYISNEFNIIFIIYDKSYIPLLELNDIDYIYGYSYYSSNNIQKKIITKIIKNRLIQKQLISMRKYSIGQYINELIFLYQCDYYTKIAKSVIKDNNIDMFITITDRHLGDKESGLFKACYDLNIPIFLPFMIAWNPQSNYLMIKDSSKYTLTNQSSTYQKKVFEKHSYQAYKNHYFYQAYKFKVLEKLGILSKMPWVSGGGIVDVNSVPNKRSYKQHIDMGIDKKKLKILGDISYIPLYNCYKNKEEEKIKIIKKYNLKHNKIFIISLANWWEHNLADKQTHWDIIHNTIKSTLYCANEYSVLVCLHPSMKLEYYEFLELKYDIKILEERLMQVLPVADIYIVDQSSTVPWAIICGIKVLIICYYKNLNLFSDFNSIVYAKKDNEIREKLKHLISKEVSFAHDWDLLSRDTIFNDKVTKKNIDVLNKLINKNEKIDENTFNLL